MARQPFDHLLEGAPSLLEAVEAIVVAAHRDWYEATGERDWSEPKAYRWLRYEDPDPVARLADGVRRLRSEIAVREREVEAALALAQQQRNR